MRKALFGLLVAATTGCGDFTLVEPPPGLATEPLLSVVLEANRSEDSHYVLRAFFFPGADFRGQLAEVADRFLYVEGNAVQPRPETDPRFFDYEWEQTRSDGGVGADSLRIQLPVLAGSPQPGPVVTIPFPGREGPAEVTWAEGEDLRLRISPAVVTTDQLMGGIVDWRLDLGLACGGSTGGGQQLFVTGRGPYPPELRVPWEWLGDAAQAPTAACFRVSIPYRVLNTPYRVEVYVNLRLDWRLRATAAS